jgi:hypothetical protein
MSTFLVCAIVFTPMFAVSPFYFRRWYIWRFPAY